MDFCGFYQSFTSIAVQFPFPVQGYFCASPTAMATRHTKCVLVCRTVKDSTVHLSGWRKYRESVFYHFPALLKMLPDSWNQKLSHYPLRRLGLPLQLTYIIKCYYHLWRRRYFPLPFFLLSSSNLGSRSGYVLCASKREETARKCVASYFAK
jgi:hypothetical protein